MGSGSSLPAGLPASAELALEQGFSQQQIDDYNNTKAILIIGAGPGISSAVARKFGGEGYKVGLVSLTLAEAEAAAAPLKESGIEVFPFECDAADEGAVKAVVESAKTALGKISILHYNAYAMDGPDLLDGAAASGIAKCCAIGCTGLVAATQALKDDLASVKGAVLVTSSGIGETTLPDELAAMVASMNIAGYLIGKAAQKKAVNLLDHKLKTEGIFVGTVNVMGMVKGTAWDDGSGAAQILPDSVAEAFWGLYKGRTDAAVAVDPPK